jgi:crotonobetainyl-CoA:carnitine CoA-transferase CaiB-like acyl-CoA transferase
VERQRSGTGQWVHSSLLQAQIAMLDFQAARWLMAGEVPVQTGNHHPTAFTTGLFPTADEPVNVCADPQPIWERFCRAVDGDDLLRDPKFADDQFRARNGDAVIEAMSEKLRKRGSKEWIERLNRCGVPCGPINRIDQVFSDPQVRHLGMVSKVDHPILGEIALVGQPVTLEGTPSRAAGAAPELGEHTDQVLRLLGHGDSRIEELRRCRVI